MKQYAFLGLGSLGMSMLERVAEITDLVVVIDKSAKRVDRIKDLVRTAFVADVMDGEAFERIFPEGIDVAVVDLVPDTEASLLVTHRLKKLGVKEIIVKTMSDEMAELAKLAGATRIVDSDREAAARITPMILSSSLYNFLPIGGDLVMAEVQVPPSLVGKTIIEADLRQRQGINVVAIRSGGGSAYRGFDRNYRLEKDDLLLAVGEENDIFGFSGVPRVRTPSSKKSFLGNLMKTFKKTRD
ncbi:MAG TPA: TrkA family potassium uptake protein [Rectinemataceae bacterium]